MEKIVLCLSNDFGPDFDGGDVLPGLTYEFMGVERGMVRVVDESGEDYMYPAASFRILSEADSQLLERSLARLAALKPLPSRVSAAWACNPLPPTVLR